MNITVEQYEALVSLARKGAPDQYALDVFLKQIEKDNNITRYLLWVQWQEADSALPPTARFPESWPESLREKIERVNKPIPKSDVLALVNMRARRPVTILVTKDPAATVGWMPVENYTG